MNWGWWNKDEYECEKWNHWMGFTCFKKKDENYELVCFVALREFFDEEIWKSDGMSDVLGLQIPENRFNPSGGGRMIIKCN